MSNYFTDIHETEQSNDERRALTVVMTSVALRINPRLQRCEDSASLHLLIAVFNIASKLLEGPTHEQAKMTIAALACKHFASDRLKLWALPAVVNEHVTISGNLTGRKKKDSERLERAKRRLWMCVHEACSDLDMIEAIADRAYSYAISIASEVSCRDDECERFAYSY